MKKIKIDTFNIRGDLFAGLSTAALSFPLALAFGVQSGMGALAGLYAAIAVGMAAAWFGGTQTIISGPTGPVTVVAAAIISWVNPDPYNPIVRFIHNITEPVLYRIRTKLPLDFGGIDFSPIIVILGIIFLQNFIVSSLFRMSASFM